jgi:hypothetical protein
VSHTWRYSPFQALLHISEHLSGVLKYESGKNVLCYTHCGHVKIHCDLSITSQQPFFINISTGICGDNLFGSHVLPNRLTGVFLENNIPVFLAEVTLIIRLELHFMHDGAPTHFSLVSCRYLNQKFPGRWIG